MRRDVRSPSRVVRNRITPDSTWSWAPKPESKWIVAVRPQPPLGRQVEWVVTPADTDASQDRSLRIERQDFNHDA